MQARRASDARPPRARFPRLSPIAAGLALAVGGACQLPEERVEPAPLVGAPGALARIQPGDIVVAPIRNQSGNTSVPVEDLREALVVALLDRLYNPLDLAYVDKSWVESGFGGTPAPDGLLVMAITAWDPSHLYSSGKIDGTAEVLLFEGASTTGQPLWGRTLEHTMDLSDGHGNPPSPSEFLMPEAARQFAVEALAHLPERDPVAAHAPSPTP